MAIRVNAYADFAYQVDVKARNSLGVMDTPEAGELAGMTGRLALTKTGPAIHPDVDGFALTETGLTNDNGRRFAYVMDTTTQQAHILPLGHGTRYYLIPTLPGNLDNEAIPFIVAAGKVV